MHSSGDDEAGGLWATQFTPAKEKIKANNAAGSHGSNLHELEGSHEMIHETALRKSMTPLLLFLTAGR